MEFVFKKPILYFVAGAGGNWLSYLTWCGLNKTTLPHDFVRFHVEDLSKFIPDYSRYYQYVPHQNLKATRDICLGGDNALLNYYINIRTKNPASDTCSAGGYIKMRGNPLLSYNLNYSDIFLDPEKFINQLREITGYYILYDSNTKRAIDQYCNSCWWASKTFDELADTPCVQEAWTYCFDNLTDLNQSHGARTDQAWDIVKQHLLVLK